MTEIIWKEHALNFLRKIDKKDSKRIVKKLNKEISHNINRYLKFLINKDFYKIKIGDYRLFVDYISKEDKLIINTIKSRKNAYK